MHLPRALRHIALTALVVSALCHHGLFDDLFGDAFARLAESYGVFFFGAVVLFVACSWVMLRLHKTEWPTADA